MHIGLSRPSPPPWPIPDVDGALIARMAEELGFESIFYGEHPVSPVADDGYATHAEGVPFFQDTLVMLSRASAVTSRIRLGSGVFLLPVHHPVLFAKQLASLDFYSGGRLIVGAGVGWSRIECEAMGGNFDRRWAQAREAVEVMKRLWTEDVASYEGEFFTVPPVRLFPKSAARPGPPILLPGPSFDEGSDFTSPRATRALRRIAAYADGWLPARVGRDQIASGPDTIRSGRERLAELCAELGRDPSMLSVTVLLRLDVVPGDETWPDQVPRDLLSRYAHAGADRAIFTIPPVTNAEEAERTLRRMAECLL